MFNFLYSALLFLLALFSLPKLLWQWKVKGKYKKSFSARLGIKLPNFKPRQGAQVIWLHAISMGETRALIPLFHKLQSRHPTAQIVISTTTETGHEEAKRSMPSAAAHFFLPLDFAWSVRRVIRHVRPTLLVLCEGDFWYNLLRIAKQERAKICVVNGKISERSYLRFKKLPFFTKRLFSLPDLFCVQNALYEERFLGLGVPSTAICITGNLKLDMQPAWMSTEEREALLQYLHITATDRILVIGSTHAKEEEWFLQAIEQVSSKIPNLKVLIVPRHPERFDEVAELLVKKGISFTRYSDQIPQPAPFILVDKMGILNQCYQIAEIAIVAGSFVKHVGGHNLFEPTFYHVPVLFGPNTFAQQELKELILEGQAGLEVELEELPALLFKLFQEKTLFKELKDHCVSLIEHIRGATERTLVEIEKFLEKS